MSVVRIIPRLDIKGPNLVKGIHLEGLRVLGKPEQFARYYYEQGADELMFMDVVASLYDRNSLQDMISKTARELFIPLTVGGGIRTLEDIKTVLRAGADKVSLNTAAIKNPNFIREAALKYGTSTIVVTIEAIKQPGGEYLAYTDNGREHTGKEVIGWARQAEELGAGELIITSVDREGTGLGFDQELIKMITKAVSIPVVVHGGAGKLADITEVLSDGNVSAITLASSLHYHAITEIKPEGGGEGEGNTEFLKSGKAFTKINPLTIGQIKEHLSANNIEVRK
jgi:imidazole glycerol-phosphate synthase subunit HisF